MQETVTPAEPVEATTPTFAPEGEAVEAPQEAEAEGATPAATEESPESESDDSPPWEAFDSEDHPHREKWTEYVQSQQEKGWNDAVSYLKPMAEQAQQLEQRRVELFTEANASFQTFAGRLQKLVTDGLMDESTLTNAIQSNPKAWEGLKAIGEDAQGKARQQGQMEGQFQARYEVGQGLLEQLFKAVGRPSLIQQFAGRIKDAREREMKGMQGDPNLFDDAVSEALKHHFATAKQIGVKGGKEVAKTEFRKDQKPPQGGGSAGGTSISSMGDADMRYNLPDSDPRHITHEEYKQAREQFGIDKRSR